MSEKDAQLEEERNKRAAEAERGKALEGELSGVKAERNAHAKEIEETLNQLQEIKQQVSEKGAQLEEERNKRAAEAERGKALEGELSGVKAERDAHAKEIEETLNQLQEIKQQVSEKTLNSRKKETREPLKQNGDCYEK